MRFSRVMWRSAPDSFHIPHMGKIRYGGFHRRSLLYRGIDYAHGVCRASLRNRTLFLATSTIGISSADLDADELSAALDSYLSRNVDCTHEPGVAVAVVTSQGVAYMRTFGTCESAGDAFYIGSLSKSMCAVAIMQLVEQGKSTLTPASDYAPEYLISPEVSVRMLLNQTSGFE